MSGATCVVELIGGKGRGVIARRDLVPGDILECAPVIVVPATDVDMVRGTVLNHYWYEWKEDETYAIAGGCGSFYNHSFDPNADFMKDLDGLSMNYIVLRPIAAGDEITINYNGPGYHESVGFEVR